MSISVDEAKDLVAELCRLFYDQGWVGGTGVYACVCAPGVVVAAVALRRLQLHKQTAQHSAVAVAAPQCGGCLIL